MTSWRATASAAQKRYKNRKKTIRARWRAGRIDEAERNDLLSEAFDRLRRDSLGAALDRPPVTVWDVGLAYLAVHGSGSLPAPCDPSAQGDACGPACVGAENPRCSCRCRGANHGAAHWRDRAAAGLCRCGARLTTGIAADTGECPDCAAARWERASTAA